MVFSCNHFVFVLVLRRKKQPEAQIQYVGFHTIVGHLSHAEAGHVVRSGAVVAADQSTPLAAR